LTGITVWDGFGHTVLGIIEALAPLLVLFIIFQLTVLKLPRSYVFNLLKGSILALAGLALFLQGVHIGFFPAGQAIGEILGSIRFQWLLIPFGFMMGFLATWGEPAVRILSEQVEEASAGSIRKMIVLYTIAGGVALFIALGMAKIIYGIPLLWIVIPGYLLAIGMLWFSDKSVIAVAFDAGGVATGPMAVTFLMAMAVGIASGIQGRDPVIDGFGLIALIALAPILTIMVLGLIIRIKIRSRKEENATMADKSLIVSIVRKGWGDKILQNSCKVGAEGGTIMFGRGVGVHEKQTILGIPIEPEKEIVLTVTNTDVTDAVLEEIVKTAELGKPGAGIAFVLPVEKVVGVVHQSNGICTI
jgi:nitrogen regulatory protein PII